MEGAGRAKGPIRNAHAFAAAAMPARYVLERGAWAEAASLTPRPSDYPYTEALTHFARAIGLARAGRPEEAMADVAALRRIAEAFGCRRQTVETIRQRLVESGFQETLDGKQRAEPPTEKLLDGEQEAKIIATRLGSPPKGYANWSLRLLARKVVELEIADTVSYETVRRVLKKRE